MERIDDELVVAHRLQFIRDALVVADAVHVLAAWLIAHPEVRRVDVEGPYDHARRWPGRARAICDELTRCGVDPGRLVATTDEFGRFTVV